jgi:hypothetical protein
MKARYERVSFGARLLTGLGMAGGTSCRPREDFRADQWVKLNFFFCKISATGTENEFVEKKEIIFKALMKAESYNCFLGIVRTTFT